MYDALAVCPLVHHLWDAKPLPSFDDWLKRLHKSNRDVDNIEWVIFDTSQSPERVAGSINLHALDKEGSRGTIGRWIAEPFQVSLPFSLSRGFSSQS